MNPKKGRLKTEICFQTAFVMCLSPYPNFTSSPNTSRHNFLTLP